MLCGTCAARMPFWTMALNPARRVYASLHAPRQSHWSCGSRPLPGLPGPILSQELRLHLYIAPRAKPQQIFLASGHSGRPTLVRKAGSHTPDASAWPHRKDRWISRQGLPVVTADFTLSHSRQHRQDFEKTVDCSSHIVQFQCEIIGLHDFSCFLMFRDFLRDFELGKWYSLLTPRVFAMFQVFARFRDSFFDFFCLFLWFFLFLFLLLFYCCIRFYCSVVFFPCLHSKDAKQWTVK